MTQSDRIAIAIHSVDRLVAQINNIIGHSRLDDKLSTPLLDAVHDMGLIRQALEDYETEYTRYIESGQAARDRDEGEALRGEER